MFLSKDPQALIGGRLLGALCALLLSLFMLVALVACSSNKDPFSAYKNKSSAKIYMQAEKNLAHKDYKKAVADLEALDGLYPFGPFAQQGQLESIYAYLKNDNPALALAAAQAYIRLYPRATNVDYAYYMQGYINFNMGGGWLQKRLGLDRSSRDISNYNDAFSSFAMLLERFPDSPYAYDARIRMLFIRNIIANHEYEVAQFYWQRQAYVAAANRATGIIQHFQGAADVVPAWAMLVRCDRKLGLTADAARALAILHYNYPNSVAYKGLKKTS